MKEYPLLKSLELIKKALSVKGMQLPENIDFRIINSEGFNIEVKLKSGHYQCLIHRDALEITYATCMFVSLYYSRNTVQEFPRVFKGNDLHCFISIIQRYALKKSAEKPESYYENLNKCEEYDVDRIYLSVFTFIIAHEISHILLGHLNGSSEHLIRFIKNDNDERYSQEFEADKLATEILLIIDQLNSYSGRLSCGGINFFLIFQIICVAQSSAYSKILEDDGNELSSHPSPQKRIVTIRQLIESELGSGSIDCQAIKFDCRKFFIFLYDLEKYLNLKEHFSAV